MIIACCYIQLKCFHLSKKFIWGPLCLITCWYILNGSPKQYFFQLVASLCHLFSCSLYFIMDLPEATHCNPNPYYFYIYFVSFNLPWLIVRWYQMFFFSSTHNVHIFFRYPLPCYAKVTDT